MLKKLFYPFEEIKLNNYIGSHLWLLHRAAGIITLAFVGMHFWALSAAIDGRQSFDARMAAFKSPIFVVFEALILFIGIFHMLNGMRLIAIEILHFNRAQKALATAVFIATAVAFALIAWATIHHIKM